jgi:hypothetical protein
MNDEIAFRLTELDERIARVREELRELSDRAAATSGPAGEERIAEMIAEKEDQLAESLRARESEQP